MRLIPLLFVLPVATVLMAQSLDVDAANRVFQEANDLSDKDGGRLWGRPLAGPILLVEIESRHAITNEPDDKGVLVQKGKIYEGTLPRLFGSRTIFAGHTWTVFMWPLAQMSHDPEPVNLAHELWHHIQADLGLDPEDILCPHLDSLEGRISIRMEMRALHAALKATGKSRRRIVRYALAVRAERNRRFPSGASQESSQEISEGLAEYTGVMVGMKPSDRVGLALNNLEQGDRIPNFCRSFAYRTGPAWGLMLDDAKPGWRKTLHSDSSLSATLARAMNLPSSSTTDFRAAAKRYDGKVIRTEEEARDHANREHLAEIKRRFVDGPLLRLPRMSGGTVASKTNEMETVGEGRTYQRTLRADFPWGLLEVSDGAVLSEEFIEVQAPSQSSPGPQLNGPGWTLTLKVNWILTPAPRTGDWTLSRKE